MRGGKIFSFFSFKFARYDLRSDTGITHSQCCMAKRTVAATHLLPWRHNDLKTTIEYMSEKGFLFCDKLIGVTKRLYKYIDREQKIHLSIPRGLEIDQWIDTNIHSNNGKDWNRKEIGKDFTYVILDDDADMLLEQKDYFIHTNGMIGLTEIEATRAVAILNFINTGLPDELHYETRSKAIG